MAVSAYGGNPYVQQLAAFSNLYGNPNPNMFDPGFYGMMDMYSAMCGYNPMMFNPMFSSTVMNPAGYDAMQRGLNPTGGFWFNNDPAKYQNYNSKQSILASGISKLHNYAINDNQDDFADEYNKLVSIQKSLLKDTLKYKPDESDLDFDQRLTAEAKARINNMYAAQTNAPLAGVLQASGDSPFAQGIKDSLTLGLFNDKKTVQENIVNVNNAGNSNARIRERKQQMAGRVLGAAAGIAGIAALASIGPFGWGILGVGVVGLGLIHWLSK